MPIPIPPGRLFFRRRIDTRTRETIAAAASAAKVSASVARFDICLSPYSGILGADTLVKDAPTEVLALAELTSRYIVPLDRLTEFLRDDAARRQRPTLTVEGICVGCGAWTPNGNPEAHDHEPNCIEMARVRAEGCATPDGAQVPDESDLEFAIDAIFRLAHAARSAQPRLMSAPGPGSVEIAAVRAADKLMARGWRWNPGESPYVYKVPARDEQADMRAELNRTMDAVAERVGFNRETGKWASPAPLPPPDEGYTIAKGFSGDGLCYRVHLAMPNWIVTVTRIDGHQLQDQFECSHDPVCGPDAADMAEAEVRIDATLERMRKEPVPTPEERLAAIVHPSPRVQPLPGTVTDEDRARMSADAQRDRDAAARVLDGNPAEGKGHIIGEPMMDDIPAREYFISGPPRPQPPPPAPPCPPQADYTSAGEEP